MSSWISYERRTDESQQVEDKYLDMLEHVKNVAKTFFKRGQRSWFLRIRLQLFVL
jgi:hypothetical protein